MRAIAILLACCGILGGETVRVELPANTIQILATDEPSTFVVRRPLGLEHQIRDVVQSYTNGQPVITTACIFYTGSAGTIVIDAFSNGERVPNVKQFVIRVTGGAPDPPDPDPPKPDPGPEPGPIPDTQYGVGPAVAREFPRELRAKVAAIFDGTATRMSQERFSIQRSNQIVYEMLGEVLTDWAPYEVYKRIMSKAYHDDRIVTQADCIGAYREIGEWLRK